MGKKKPTLVKPTQRMTKKERSRWERERRVQRTFIIVLVAIGVIAVLLLAFGLLYDSVWYPRGVVAEVNGQPLTRHDYWQVRRMDLVTQWQQVYQNLQLYQSLGITLTEEQSEGIRSQLTSVLSQLGNVEKESTPDETAMQTLIEETVVFQGAGDLGIVVTDEEADIFLWPDPQTVSPTVSTTEPGTAPTPVSTLTPQERAGQLREGVASFYDSLREDMRNSGSGSLGFSVSDYLGMVRRSARLSLVEEKVKEHLAEDLPKTEEQVQAFHILLQSRRVRAQEAYQAVSLAIAQGQSLAAIVVEYSDDAASRNRVGEVEIRRGEVSPALEEAAFALTESEPYSGVIEDAAGVHLLKFVRRNEATDSVVAQHILISADRAAVAEAVWAEVVAQPGSFASIAIARSEDEETASSGGDLGWIVQGDGQLSPLVEASAFALTQTNAVSAPILDEEGYHLLQLLQRDDENQQVRVRQILIRNGAGLAQQLLDDIRAGTLSFTQAVVDYSEDQDSLDKAGDIGWVSRNDALLPTEVISAAFALSPTGSLTSIIEVPEGYYIAQLLERDDANDRRHLRILMLKRAELLLQEIRDYIIGGDAETRVDRFAEMALKYSDDSESNTNGGDLGWFGRGKTANTIEIEEQAFAIEAGEFSEVFEGASGWHLVWVRDHAMNHPIDQETLDQRAQEKYEEWKAELLNQAEVVRYPAPTPTPTPTPPPFVPTLIPPTEPITGSVTP